MLGGLPERSAFPGGVRAVLEACGRIKQEPAAKPQQGFTAGLYEKEFALL
jgi:hypothetical protein